MSRTVVALYDTRSEAELARAWLISEFRPKSLRIIGKDTAAAVDGLKIARSDAKAYREGLQRGGHLLVAELPSGAPAEQIIELLEQSMGSGTNHRSDPQGADFVEGVWVELPDEGKAEKPDDPESEKLEQVPPQPPAEPQVRGEAAPVPSPAAEPVADSVPAEEERVPLVEEELRIGKRQVAGGGARVHSFTRESPAEEQVVLREELIDVESRPCDRRLTESEIEAAGLFKERTFEVAAMREEPVVTKTAVVREEMIVTKKVRERPETVRDTVRRTEVEVEDLPAPAPERPTFFVRDRQSKR